MCIIREPGLLFFCWKLCHETNYAKQNHQVAVLLKATFDNGRAEVLWQWKLCSVSFHKAVNRSLHALLNYTVLVNNSATGLTLERVTLYKYVLMCCSQQTLRYCTGKTKMNRFGLCKTVVLPWPSERLDHVWHSE